MISRFIAPALAPLLPWILGTLAALFLALGGTILVQRLELRAAASQTRAAEIERDFAIAANTHNRQVIADLEAANNELARGRKADQDAAARAVQDLKDYRRITSGELAAARAAREAIYANDSSAADWSRQPVPDGVAGRLRR